MDAQLTECCRLRADFATLFTDDQARYIAAVLRVATDPQLKPRYDAFLSKYTSSLNTLAQRTNPTTSQFLVLNRLFLLEYENFLREVDCRITIPVWDWTLLPLTPYMSPVFSSTEDGFGGSSRSNDSCVNEGPFRVGVFSITDGGCLQRQYRMKMFPTRAIIERDLLTLPANEFDRFHQLLQVFIHTNVRCFVGGQMCSADAANDPLFLLHLSHRPRPSQRPFLSRSQ